MEFKKDFKREENTFSTKKKERKHATVLCTVQYDTPSSQNTITKVHFKVVDIGGEGRTEELKRRLPPPLCTPMLADTVYYYS